jgi:hypothetical protein
VNKGDQGTIRHCLSPREWPGGGGDMGREEGRVSKSGEAFESISGRWPVR